MDAPPRPAAARARAIATLIGCGVLWLLAMPASPAAAHPLGNFTVNTYAGLRISPDEVAVDFVVDLAEVATVQAREFADDDADGEVDDAEWASYAEAGCTRWSGEVELVEAKSRLGLRVDDVDHRVQPGEAGVPTLRIECAFTADRAAGDVERRIAFADKTFPDRQGWRETTAIGDRTTLVSSTVTQHSTSERLTAYPDAGMKDPIDVRTAEIVVAPGGPSAANGSGSDVATGTEGFLEVGTWAAALDQVVTDGLVGDGLTALAILAALALGALHALAPGHGKSVIAAYLVGQRGSLRHAGVLSLSVTLTHTVGVLVLGTALWTASMTAPERLYPLLGMLSGAIIVGIGVSLLLRHRRHRAHHDHRDDHDHRAHHHHSEDRGTQARPAGATPSGEPLPARTVVALGFAGGLVPTPSALLVLLGALSVGKVWFGILLVGCYGVGMALALVGIGVALSHARGRLEDRLNRRPIRRLHALSHALPQVTATVVTMAGVVVIARSAL